MIQSMGLYLFPVCLVVVRVLQVAMTDDSLSPCGSLRATLRSRSHSEWCQLLPVQRTIITPVLSSEWEDWFERQIVAPLSDVL